MKGNSPATDASMSAVLTTCTVDCETIGGSVAINIAGELDMADADRVGQILADAARTATTSVRVRLADLTFADSSAVRVLLLASMIAGERGVVFQIVEPHSSVQRLLEVTGLTDALPVVGERAG